MQFGLIGEKLGHSFSSAIHAKIGLYEYELHELPPDSLETFLAKADFRGVNVTIPYKEAVIPFLDELSERASAIGAVNTIVNRRGKLCGYNTDFGGLEALIRKMGLQLEGETVLIAGAGGTAKTAQAVAESLGAAQVFKLSRTGREGALTYEQAYASFPDARILINTTPVGMYPDTQSTPVDLSRLPGLAGVVDVVYNPLTTRLVEEARAKGIAAENGLYMLVAQAVFAAELFTGASLGEGEIQRIYRELLLEVDDAIPSKPESLG